jgi:class 3 adenylate cyclase
LADIEGSSQLWEIHSESMQPAVIRHNHLLRNVVEGHGGHVVKLRGDGVLAFFAEA